MEEQEYTRRKVLEAIMAATPFLAFNWSAVPSARANTQKDDEF